MLYIWLFLRLVLHVLDLKADLLCKIFQILKMLTGTGTCSFVSFVVELVHFDFEFCHQRFYLFDSIHFVLCC